MFSNKDKSLSYNFEKKDILLIFKMVFFFCRQRSTRMRQNPDPVKNSPSSKNTQEPFSDVITLNEEGTGAVYNRVMHSSPIVMFNVYVLKPM